MDQASGDALTGREAELSALEELVTGIAAGRGGLGWLHGEPGIGKSALLDAVAARASARGITVLRGAADELTQEFPLRLMAESLEISEPSSEMFDEHIAGMVRGDPVAPGAVAPVLAAAERMLALVERRCADGPLLLVVDDLQWADESSLALWTRLARGAGEAPLLMIGAARSLPARVELHRFSDLVATSRGAVISLRPLDAGSVAELAGPIVTGTPGPRLRAALARAGGNPLYVREMASALARGGRVRVSGTVAELDGDPQVTPASLTLAVNGRLAFLPEDSRRALRMAALLGSEFEADEWATVTKRPMTQIADLVEAAVASGVLSDAGDRLRFRHDLIWQVVAEQTPAAMRRALHGDFARLLAQSGSGADAVARHLLPLPGPIDGWALSWLAETSEPRLYACPRTWARLLERAVESVGQDHSLWPQLATRLAVVLFWLGRDEQASEVSTAVLQGTGEVILAARMREQIIRSAHRLQRPERALRQITAGRGDDRLPSAWNARLTAWSALILRDVGQASRAAAMAQDALAIATAAGDPLAIACARYASAACDPASATARTVAPAHAIAGLAALSTLAAHDPEPVELRLLLLGRRLLQTADLEGREETEATLSAALALADRSGSFHAAVVRTAATGICYRYGRWDEALSHSGRIDAEFLETRQLLPHRGLLALIALHREDREAAERQLTAAADALAAATPSMPGPLPSPLALALAVQAEVMGNPRRGVELLSGCLRAAPAEWPGDRQLELTCLARLALAAGDAGAARAAAAASQSDVSSQDEAGTQRAPGRVAAARFCQALAGDDVGGLMAVAQEYRMHGWLPHSALALEEAAVRLATAGDTSDARAALTASVRIRTDLGATWDIRRADARLRPYGVRRGPRSMHRRAATGWAALTPSEQRISWLVARGLSNGDIASELVLSRRTVQTHVSKILAKLQLNSRVGIVRAVALRQSDEPEH
jgi:DNA-binding CsgD family transcriptional regulator